MPFQYENVKQNNFSLQDGKENQCIWNKIFSCNSICK
jgi:hypothetical protein